MHEVDPVRDLVPLRANCHQKLAKARKHIAVGLNVREAAARVKIGKAALYRALKAEKSDVSKLKLT